MDLDGAQFIDEAVNAGVLPVELARRLRDWNASRSAPASGELAATWIDAGDSVGALETIQPGPSAGSLPGAEPAVDLDPARGGAVSPPGPRYQVRRLLGRGGMGVVHVAVDRDLRREVAVKTLGAPFDARLARRFFEEARITGQLEHPNIVPVHDVGVDPATRRPYLVMKRVEGKSLSDTLAEARTAKALRGLLEVFGKVVDGVAFAHSRGAIHRDLKPDNVMVGEFGEVLVMDWGLARMRNAQAGTREEGASSYSADPLQTQAGSVIGTPSYMSPEQAQGGGSEADERSDVYGLGAILYEILALVPPVEEESPSETIFKAAIGDVRPPSERSRAPWPIPRELEEIAIKCLALDPRRRYASATALRADLDAYLEDRAVAAVEYSAWQLIAKWARRHRAQVVGTLGSAAALLSGLVAVIVILAWSSRRLEVERAEAVARAEEVESLLAEKGRREEALALVEKARVELEAAEWSLYQPGPERAYLEEQAGRAEAWLGQAIELCPDLALGHHLVGRARELLGDSGGAREAWQAAIAADPGFGASHLALAREAFTRVLLSGRYASGDTLEPIVPWARIRAWSEEARRHLERGQALGVGLGEEMLVRECEILEWLQRGDPEAISLASAALSRFRGRQGVEAFHFLKGLGTTHGVAVESLDLALEIRPGFAEARIERAFWRRVAGDLPGALEDLDRALALLPGLVLGRILRGQVCRQMGDLDRALAEYGRALAIEPGNPVALDSIGNVHAQRTDWKNALAAYDAAIESDAEFAISWFHRGEVHSALGDFPRALEDLGRAIAVDPGFVRALRARADVRRRTGDLRGALEDFDRVIEGADPPAAMDYLCRCSLRVSLEDPAGALADAQTAISLATESEASGAYSSRARVLAELGRVEEALADYDRAIELGRGNLMAYVNRAAIRYNRNAPGDLGAAIADFEEVLRIAPPDWPSRPKVQGYLEEARRRAGR